MNLDYGIEESNKREPENLNIFELGLNSDWAYFQAGFESNQREPELDPKIKCTLLLDPSPA